MPDEAVSCAVTTGDGDGTAAGGACSIHLSKSVETHPFLLATN